MGTQQENGNQGVREIPKWAGRYSRNRTLSIVVSQAIFIYGALMFGGLSYLTGLAYVHGHRTLAALGVLLLSAWSAFWLWFSFVGGRRMIPKIASWLYRGEGQVLPDQSGFVIRGPRLTWVGAVFAFCILAQVGLGLLGFLPIRLLQPVSAIYVVPFLLYLGWALRDRGSPFMFLWPVLYGAHAILLLFGVMPSLGPMLDMFVPTVGYGLLAALAGHIYSRLALRKLRSLTSEPPPPGVSVDG
ncbi:MAG: hypothetical protein JXA57_18480 [Armatimonadetes bacterium]|nr:hypothetical protein [Armatimonadota bacterium]